MYTLDEIIRGEKNPEKKKSLERGKSGEEKIERLDEEVRARMNTRIENMWKVLGLEDYKKDFIKDGKFLLDEDGMAFFHELVNRRIGNEIWNRCIRKKKIRATTIVISNEEKDVFDEVDYITNGLIKCYEKLKVSEERKESFKECLYRETNYRKLKLKRTVDLRIDSLPELTQEIIYDSIGGGYIIPEYQMLFDDLKEGFDRLMTKEIKAWKKRKITSSKGYISLLKSDKLTPDLPEEMSFFSNRDLDALVEELSQIEPKSYNYADKKNMKMVVYDYLYRERREGINEFSYEELINYSKDEDIHKERAAAALKNEYSNATRYWAEILKLCGIEDIKEMKIRDEWVFDEDDAKIVSELLSQYQSNVWKPIKSELKKGKTTLEIYWNNGAIVWYSINTMVEGFKKFFKKNFDHRYRELVSILYRRFQYIELLTFHRWAVYVGAELTGKKTWKFKRSDYNVDNLKDFLEELNNKILDLENEIKISDSNI